MDLLDIAIESADPEGEGTITEVQKEVINPDGSSSFVHDYYSFTKTPATADQLSLKNYGMEIPYFIGMEKPAAKTLPVQINKNLLPKIK
jgi:hypothetical protein